MIVGMAILIHFISLISAAKKKKEKKDEKELKKKLFTVLFPVIFSIAVPSVQGLMESDYVNAKICYSTDLIISKFKVTSFLVTSYDGE